METVVENALAHVVYYYRSTSIDFQSDLVSIIDFSLLLPSS